MSTTIPIIPQPILQQAKRLLFISPLALGDFLYIKTFLIALKAKQPGLEIDLWLDDNRNNQDSWRLSRSKIMKQWIESEPAFNHTYGCCSSKEEQEKLIASAKERNYDIIVTEPTSKSERFASIARQINSDGYLVCGVEKKRFAGLLNNWFYRGADKTYSLDVGKLKAQHHITDRYHLLIDSLFGIDIDKAQFMPDMTIPQAFNQATASWIANNFKANDSQGKLIFLNHLSTNSKRDWRLEQLFGLIEQLHAQASESRFVINVTPDHVDSIRSKIADDPKLAAMNIAVFTVGDHFFELPALIAASDIVITVETAIMHFATAMKRPLIAMMRQKKPYWAPPVTPTAQVLYAEKGRGHVSDIDVEDVLKCYAQMKNSI
ncbi:glycosyltransferase family 9 protein [uncultured Shewanella sp.]|uniref:glycosyltransferase family 9 protein n=1 Tax=uncultured Shewanella sp. TaxID=173975 RepID=UPI00260AE573|nr:glycosyltransferase family 9 protein [uncultured Shewanella sp.]